MTSEHGVRRIRRQRILAVTAFLLLLALGLFYRASLLAFPPLWTDEAESGINALTILEHGVPVDRYLGIPIYENTLLEPWPEHAEYEFKDSSYSDRGFAIYHGWFPLYAIAGSFALFGIEPDDSNDLSSLDRGLEDFQKRTLAARFPSLVFSLAFMLLVFRAGQEYYGPAAAWAALTIAALSNSFVWHGIQARYYSAALMLSAALCLLMLRVKRRGGWWDYLGAAVVFVLLFHTHILTCFFAAVVFLLMLPAMRRQEHFVWKLGAFAVVGVLGSVPWMIYSGYLDALGGLPRAWPLLSLPWDMLDYRKERLAYFAVFLVGGMWLWVVRLVPTRVPERLRLPFQGNGDAFLLLYAWLVVAVLAFPLLIPAASFFSNRLAVSIAAPGVILASMIIGAGAGVVSVRRAPVITVVTCLLLLLTTDRLQPEDFGQHQRVANTYSPVELFKQLVVDERTRVYATPSGHLIHSFYSGIPVQSIAPVRKSFLDAYGGDVLLVTRNFKGIRPDDPLHWERLQERAREAGVPLGSEEAKAWAERLATWSSREELVTNGFTVYPPPEELPSYFAGAVAEQRALTPGRHAAWVREWSGTLMFRGYDLQRLGWWPVFFYRFVDPEKRGGDKLNYTERMRNGRVHVPIGSRWKIFHSPPVRHGK